jgi:hypothetical protein
MSFNFSLISFFILIIAYLVIVEIFTVLFRLTGLREDKARFQAISLMTNSGYTSKESELIMNSSIRKNLATLMMLFGYIFAVSGVSLLVNLFIRAGEAQLNWLTLLYSLLFLLIIIAITRSKWLIRHFDRLIEYLAQKKDDGMFCNNIRILEMIHDKLIAEVLITRLPTEISGKNLEETNFSRTYMLNVLLIKRGSQIIDHVTPRDELKKGDRVLIYGSKKHIIELFKENAVKNQN